MWPSVTPSLALWLSAALHWTDWYVQPHCLPVSLTTAESGHQSLSASSRPPSLCRSRSRSQDWQPRPQDWLHRSTGCCSLPPPLPSSQLGGPRSAVQCGHISARSRHCRPAALYDSSASLSAEWRHNLALPGSGAASHSHRSIDWLTDWLTDWYRFLITGWGSDRSQAALLPWRSNLLPPFFPPSHTCVTLPQLATHLLHRYIGTFLQKIILF